MFLNPLSDGIQIKAVLMGGGGIEYFHVYFTCIHVCTREIHMLHIWEWSLILKNDPCLKNGTLKLFLGNFFKSQFLIDCDKHSMPPPLPPSDKGLMGKIKMS